MKKETEKERQKRIQLTKAEKVTKGSGSYSFTPCVGTMVNAGFDKNKKQIQEQINYRVSKTPKQVSSTKLGKQSSAKFLRKTERKGRYQPQLLTVLLVMRMTKKQREGVKIDRYHAFKPVRKI